jgi:hypothetical protein
MKYTIVIPTRNSSEWLGVLLREYCKLHVRPFFVVDERSIDSTLDIIKNEKADYITYKPQFDYAEDGMIKEACNHVDTPWVLRLDDDEFPSQGLLSWLNQFDQQNKIVCWSISRRDISYINHKFVFSQWPTRFKHTRNGLVFNPQARLFKHESIEFINHVHTPGIVVPQNNSYAPNHAFFVHFNNIVRSSQQRLDKVRYYAQFKLTESWRLADETLPELTYKDFHDFSDHSLHEFIDLFRSLPSNHVSNNLDITPDELMAINYHNQAWLVDSLKELQNERELYVPILFSIDNFISTRSFKYFSEFLMSSGRALRINAIYQMGRYLWRLYEFLLRNQ